MKDLVTKSFVYQFKNTDDCFVGCSCYGVKEVLKRLRDGDDIKEVVKMTYAYKQRYICSLLKEERIPLEQVTELEQTSYRLVLRGKEIGQEKILNFTKALNKAKATNGAEGLLEIVERFDRDGNVLRSQTSYLLSGEIFLSDMLPEKIAQLNGSAVFIQEFNENLKDKISRCIMTPSGVIGFVGKRVRSLNSYL